MSHLLRALRAPLAIAALLVAAPAALAAPTISSLRVEAGGDALSPGTSYVHDTTRITSSRAKACGGTGDTTTVQGPTALGLLAHGARADGRPVFPVRVSDKFSFGLFVCGVGANLGSAEKFWTYKVNHVAPEIGADQFRVKRGDEVLWIYNDTVNNINTGDELVLSAPTRSRSGDTFIVSVRAYDATGASKPAEGAKILGGGGAVTGPAGRATIRASGRFTARLRATRGADVASEPKRVCIDSRLSRCPSRRGETIVGTRSRDRIAAGPGNDVVSSRSGNDRIDVIGGRRDVVRCGRGLDTVMADRADRVSGDCERVIRRRVVGISPVEN